jgi:uncharacterized protein YkwD
MIGIVCALSIGLICPHRTTEPVPIDQIQHASLKAQPALAAVNAYRRKHGLKPLVYDERLSHAAAMQAGYVAAHGEVGHTGSGGSNPLTRVQQTGYGPRLAAENVAAGEDSFAEAMQDWEKSPRHKHVLLLPDAEAVGAAASYGRDGRIYWTLVLGAKLSSAN